MNHGHEPFLAAFHNAKIFHTADHNAITIIANIAHKGIVLPNTSSNPAMKNKSRNYLKNYAIDKKSCISLSLQKVVTNI